MFWADKFAEAIIRSGKHKPYRVDDMKTPSGQVHVGALRGVVVHGLIHEALIQKGKKSVYSFVINDMDPMDGFPHYLPTKFKKHMGEPLYKIPSPEKGYSSMAQCYGQQFIKVFNQLGFKPKMVWSSEWYKEGRFNQIVKEALDKVEQVRELYHQVSGYDKPKNWYPYQVICPKCGKVGTTIVTGWDGKKVAFECKKDLVKWAEGCGYKGKVEPTGDNGKLMWKVDWAAHWKVIGVTIEGAGKDHMTEGGSHDLSSAICEKVFGYKTPFNFLYEWFLAKGGSKMSSSKGVGVSAVEISKTLPAEILRFLMVKTDYKKAIIFDPNNNDSVLDLFDEYDKAAGIFYKEGIKNPMGRAWQLSQVSKAPAKMMFLARFRDVVMAIQDPKVPAEKKFEKIKKSGLTDSEKKELQKRVKYAKVWLKAYAPEDKKLQIAKKIPEQVADFSEKQKSFLSAASIATAGSTSAQELQQKYYEIAKEGNLSTKRAFETIYQSVLGKNYGPKAGWLGYENKEMVAQRLEAAARYTGEEREVTEKYIYDILSQSKWLSFSDEFKKEYPSAIAGVAVIKGIRVEKKNEGLEKLKEKELQNLARTTVSEIDQTKEIQSYRKMYKKMGVSWGSRKSSPAALLRRLAQGKGLYTINTCVDAYNLVVMKYRVSAGAFDLDKIKLPVVLDVAKGDEEVLLIGDRKPTQVKAGEVCYFDKVGPYNLDYNYKDATRTLVIEKTTDILVNTDGVYDITRTQVERTLKEVTDNIIKYCGGQLEMTGIVTAK